MPQSTLPDHERCMHTTRDGKRCRQGRMTDSVFLCYYHWNLEEQKTAGDAARTQRESKQWNAARKLFPRREHLDTPESVTRFVSRVARLLVEGEIEPRVGTSLGYLGQVILSTLSHRERVRAAAEAAAAEASANAPSANPLLEDSRELTRIDAILKSIEQHTNPDAPPAPDDSDLPDSSGANL